jgi:hypothetical protein
MTFSRVARIACGQYTHMVDPKKNREDNSLPVQCAIFPESGKSAGAKYRTHAIDSSRGID